MGTFDCKVRLKNKGDFEAIEVTNNRFDRELLKGEIREGFDRIWICATPEMQASFYEDLVALGVDKRVIYFV